MHIVVIGAGYAGTYAANRLARKTEAQITVVNPRGHFVERPRLHQTLSGTGRDVTPLTSMMRAGVTVRVAAVDKIGDGVVRLDDGDSLGFDHAVLAVGSTVRPMPGTVAVGTWEGAQEGRARLAALGPGAWVTVVGGGPTGLETASEVAAARPDLRVRLVGARIGEAFNPKARRRLFAALAGLKVEVVEDTLTEAGEGFVRVGSGRELESGLTLWAIVSGVGDLAARSGFTVNEEGRIAVDDYLRSVDDPRVFAAGDCAAVPGARFACQTAIPQGARAADNLIRLIEGRPLRPHEFRYQGICISLGRKDALLQVSHADDSPARAFFGSGPAVLAKETVLRGIKVGVRMGVGM
uniref:NAD(P)/FAD-dependent oxidoreductase n=1 Tax=Herbidospora sakaeratensis TaxID=564415 RepID=UPI000785013D|nr:FAD-dependent oxidoreductase [Herbidospora sakaeratensis]